MGKNCSVWFNAVVRGDGRVVTTRDEAAATKALEIQFADGRIGAKSTG